jgi:hypothetical protein
MSAIDKKHRLLKEAWKRSSKKIRLHVLKEETLYDKRKSNNELTTIHSIHDNYLKKLLGSTDWNSPPLGPSGFVAHTGKEDMEGVIFGSGDDEEEARRRAMKNLKDDMGFLKYNHPDLLKRFEHIKSEQDFAVSPASGALLMVIDGHSGGADVVNHNNQQYMNWMIDDKGIGRTPSEIQALRLTDSEAEELQGAFNELPEDKKQVFSAQLQEMGYYDISDVYAPDYERILDVIIENI